MKNGIAALGLGLWIALGVPTIAVRAEEPVVGLPGMRDNEDPPV